MHLVRADARRVRVGRVGVVMTYATICSGIDAPAVAWNPLGWKQVFSSEIDPFCCAVLKHHYPDVPNLGDMTRFKEWDIEPKSIDFIIAGTPCESFSVAGLREGLDDPRGNLALIYMGVIDRIRPKFMLWENVPSVLSEHEGRDFGSILGAMAFIGYGFVYRVLDAGYFGARTPRPRVFVVGYRGDWRPAGAVLFNAPGNRWDSAGDSEQSKETGTPAVFTTRGGMAHDDRSNYILDDQGLRISTPLEWERALGFPDNYTQVKYKGKPAPTSLRYRALGKSMAVPVIRWLGERIQAVEAIV